MRTKDTVAMGIMMILLVALVGGGVYMLMGGKLGQGAVTGGVPPGTITPADAKTTATITLANKLNTSGTEEYDCNIRLYDVKNGVETFSQTGTDTTAGSYANLNFGGTYRIRIMSGNSNGGCSGKILSAVGATVSADGAYADFVADVPGKTIYLYGKQHGTLEFRAYDVLANGNVYDTSDAIANDYETTGVTFSSVTANSTAIDIGQNGELHWKLYVRNVETQDDTDFTDFGAWILVDAARLIWKEPSMEFNGKVMTKGNLDDKEFLLESDTYEYAYKTLDSFTRRDSVLDFDIFAAQGVTPGGSDNIVLAFASIGASKETSGYGVRYSAATDAATPAALYAHQLATIDVQ